MINTLGNVAGYKTNIQKNSRFLYSNCEHAEKVTTKTISFTIAIGINLTKQVKVLYNNIYKPWAGKVAQVRPSVETPVLLKKTHYKTLKKEIENTPEDGCKSTHFHALGELIL
jgi:hypothetical protein